MNFLPEILLTKIVFIKAETHLTDLFDVVFFLLYVQYEDVFELSVVLHNLFANPIVLNPLIHVLQWDYECKNLIKLIIVFSLYDELRHVNPKLRTVHFESGEAQ